LQGQKAIGIPQRGNERGYAEKIFTTPQIEEATLHLSFYQCFSQKNKALRTKPVCLPTKAATQIIV